MISLFPVFNPTNDNNRNRKRKDRCLKLGDPERDDHVTLACSRNGPVCSETEEVTCYGCKNKLVWRKSHKRKKNGVSFEVKGHFMHVSPRPHYCTNESIQHAAAKDKVVRLCPEFTFRCGCCKKDCAVDVYGGNKNTAMRVEEHTWNHDKKQYRLDVALIHEGGTLGAVEVMHSHKIGEDKARALTVADVAWVEVLADDVLSANDTDPVRVLRCAHQRCGECQERIKDIERQNLKTRAEEKARVESEAAAILPSLASHEQKVRWKVEGERDLWKTVRETLEKVLRERGVETTANTLDTVLQKVSHISGGERFFYHGKYNGESLRKILSTDPGYIRWLAGYGKGEKSYNNKPKTDQAHPISRGFTIDQVKAAQELLKRHCLLCFTYVPEKWKHWCGSCYREACEFA